MSCRLDGGGSLSLDGCGWGSSPLILFSFKKGGKIVNYLYLCGFKYLRNKSIKMKFKVRSSSN